MQQVAVLSAMDQSHCAYGSRKQPPVFGCFLLVVLISLILASVAMKLLRA